MTQKKKTHFRILTPPDDLTELKSRLRKLRHEKARRWLVLIVLILLAICGTYLLLKNQTYGQARTAAEYPSDTSDSSSFAAFAGGIVRYNRDGVAFLNTRNEEQWIQPTQIQNPVIETKEDVFAVADNGGNTILVFTEDGLKGEIETTLPIEKIAISDQGIVSAILKNENTPNIITYDATGNILVEQQASLSTTGYPVALEMSGDGEVLAVSYVYTEGTALGSRVIYYNFGEEGQARADNIVSSGEYSGTLIGDIFYMDADTSVAVGDDSFIIYRGRSIPEEEKVISLNQEIQSVACSEDYLGLVLLNQEKSGYELRLYNRLGEQVIRRDLPGKYSSMKIDGDEVIMFDGSRCCIVTATGLIKFEGDIRTEAQEIFRAWGLNRYYVMNADELRVIYLTK